MLLLLGDKNPWGKPTSPEKAKYAMSQVWAVLAVVQLRGPRFSTTNGTVLVAIFWPTHNLSSWGAPSRPRGLCWPFLAQYPTCDSKSWVLQLKPLNRWE